MQLVAIDPSHGDVEVVGQAGFGVAIAFDVAQGCEAFPELVAEDPQPECPLFAVGHGLLHGSAKPHHQGHGQGSGPQAVLLVAAMELGGYGHARPDQQGADAFGAVELVAADAE